MKIISDFHDFYDSALVYNDNADEVIYIRDKISYTINKDAPKLCTEIDTRFNKYLFNDSFWRNSTGNAYWSFAKNRFSHIITNKKHNIFTEYKYLIIFCGKIYPLVKFVKETPLSIPREENTYIYTLEAFNEYLSNNEIALYSKKDSNLVERFFANSGSDIEKEFLMINKITNAVLIDGSKNSIEFNTRLADYEFYKVLDTYSCFQELDIWLSGTLSYPQNLMIEVQNDDKIIKHGFDSKYGFRTRPR